MQEKKKNRKWCLANNLQINFIKCVKMCCFCEKFTEIEVYVSRIFLYILNKVWAFLLSLRMCGFEILKVLHLKMCESLNRGVH